ncbi:MAG: hypothetical protein ABL993_00905 [Vicinamibacterales bacterium]
MTYKAVGPWMGMQALTDTSTVQNHPLGTKVVGIDNNPAASNKGEGEFIYLKGIASTVEGSLVDYDITLGVTALSPATGGEGPVAVSMSANVANQYGWYQVRGCAAVKAPNAAVVGAGVYMLAATPGSVDDAVVASEQILNAKFTTTTGTPSSGLAVIEINYPFHQGAIT